MVSFQSTLTRVRACEICKSHLPHGPRPVVQLHPDAKLLIAGQAPGRKVHESGIPFDDASGKRLREWLGVTRNTFYDPAQIAILPMGFCFPGTGNSGDLPPRSECAPAWRELLLKLLPNIETTLVLGKYAQDYHCGGSIKSVTERVKDWRDCWPKIIPAPHPSPRNVGWMKNNPWFETELLPALRRRISDVLQ